MHALTAGWALRPKVGAGGVGDWQSRAHLDLVHPVDAVQHVLEELLQRQGRLESLAPGLQQLLQVVPQAQDVVLAGRDALLVVVILLLQLLGQVFQGPHPLLIGGCVRLDGLVLLLGGLHGCQVVPKVILPQRETQAAQAGSSRLVPRCRETDVPLERLLDGRAVPKDLVLPSFSAHLIRAKFQKTKRLTRTLKKSSRFYSLCPTCGCAVRTIQSCTWLTGARHLPDSGREGASDSKPGSSKQMAWGAHTVSHSLRTLAFPFLGGM